MAWKVNFSLFINEKNEWNSLNLKVRDQGMSVVPTEKSQVLNFGPSFGIDSFFNGLLVIIDTNGYNSGFIIPFVGIFF